MTWVAQGYACKGVARGGVALGGGTSGWGGGGGGGDGLSFLEPRLLLHYGRQRSGLTDLRRAGLRSSGKKGFQINIVTEARGVPQKAPGGTLGLVPALGGLSAEGAGHNFTATHPIPPLPAAHVWTPVPEQDRQDPEHPSLPPLWPNSGRPEPKRGQSGRSRLTGSTALPQSLTSLSWEHDLLPSQDLREAKSHCPWEPSGLKGRRAGLESPGAPPP